MKFKVWLAKKLLPVGCGYIIIKTLPPLHEDDGEYMTTGPAMSAGD